jgi:hypothetical protein
MSRRRSYYQQVVILLFSQALYEELLLLSSNDHFHVRYIGCVIATMKVFNLASIYGLDDVEVYCAYGIVYLVMGK